MKSEHDGVTRYPLVWPQHKPRAKHRQKGKFTTAVRGQYTQYVPLTIAQAMTRLEIEVERLRATSLIVSTNVPTTKDGRPRGDQRAPNDPGVAVYMTWRGKLLSFACDAWTEVAQNIGAIAAHIDALRSQERWGVASIEQAFMGHMQLPGKRAWWEVLGVYEDTPTAEVDAAYKKLAHQHHPDRGGDAHTMAIVNDARDEFKKARGL